jgi:hypothetical protein
MNCPFINLESITDPELLRAAKAVWNGVACPATGFCDQCECINCPFFPEHLRENLLSIELRMLRKKTKVYERSKN